jgi:hypothetical protein
LRGDLLQFAVGKESNPLTIRREELIACALCSGKRRGLQLVALPNVELGVPVCPGLQGAENKLAPIRGDDDRGLGVHRENPRRPISALSRIASAGTGGRRHSAHDIMPAVTARTKAIAHGTFCRHESSSTVTRAMEGSGGIREISLDNDARFSYGLQARLRIFC